MKELHELNFPKDLQYSDEHVWILQDGDNFKIGISDYAQDRLGDIVFVELPEPGESFGKGDAFGTVESVKSVSELYAPLDGTIVSVNAKLEDKPELVNQAPYSDGWMIILKPLESSDMAGLMDASGYLEILQDYS